MAGLRGAGIVVKTSDELNRVASVLVDAALHVHRTLGPGLLESAYQRCLEYELLKRGVPVSCEVILPVAYDGVLLETGYRLDMLVDRSIIVENKSVHSLGAIHHAQLLTYLTLSGHSLGFLINWNVPLLKDGIKRMVHGF